MRTTNSFEDRGRHQAPSLSEESNYANDTGQKDEPPLARRTTHPVLDNENVLRQTGGPRLVGSFVPVHDGILCPLIRGSQEPSRQNCQVLEGKTAAAFRAIRKLGRTGMNCDSYLWQYQSVL
jgi:hypothetical protein